MKIAVAGLGYVGLANAVMLAAHNTVIITDIVQAKVDMVNNRVSPIEDMEIKTALATEPLDITASHADDFDFSPFPYAIIATPTNYNEKTGKFDTQSVESVIESIIKANPGTIIVIRSTIPIGFTRLMNARHNTDKILFAPEFLREGKALYDSRNPSRIVVGGNTPLAEAFADILLASSDKQDAEVLITSTDEAEAIKLFSNAYLAMRVAYFNEISTFSMTKDMNAAAVVRGVCLDPRIRDGYNNPSFGYGGYCLPKDTKQLSSNFKGIPSSIIGAIVEANDARKTFISNELLKRQGVIGIYRLVMKSGSDNFRESSVLHILNTLISAKREVVIYEPLLKEATFHSCPVIASLSEFKATSGTIAANRMSHELSDVATKVFTCDIYGRD
ncbi:MAG: nucleotide sugar dehydrogenase [Defluviitaleaceae bacterium]|nr:nucleotide sugar dehydrogenase [Defluviitaleaceae bacterium]MCL2239564.1 nucleotide sugar dehydrogenase [Defluviitaleaceae bacterium]